MSKLSKWIDTNVTHKSAAKEQMQAAREQISLYQQQKEQLHTEASRVAAEKDMERQKIHAKQIRALRRNFRSPGFMQASTDVSQTLG